MQHQPVTTWSDYELIDFGRGRKLERFGPYVLDRPESQAVNDVSLTVQAWKNLADARYDGPETGKGQWILKGAIPDIWEVRYFDKILKIQLFLSPFKHIGLFPEQFDNWQYIARKVEQLKEPRVLNLFAYTGAASLVARSAGAHVTHVDASKSIVNRARQNFEGNTFSDVRLIIEDAVKFVARELRRESVYQGIILDPPAFGRGPKGEVWKLEDHLPELLQHVSKLLDPENGFLIMNTYSPAYSLERTHELLKEYFPKTYNIDSEWLTITTRDGRSLPMNIVNRVSRQP
ncbi:MAG: class I SAM-dependent methyltransferase [Bacteroidetes bacterium]|nr:class I SAM-dependent methyltransferase [Bacteroidota bacterium]MCH8524116.1 class I SAM-dependent methyltransferase [Balneolales bacterium]